MIPGISTLKTWGIAILGFAATIFYALFRTQQAKRAKEKLEGIKIARKIEHGAAKQLQTDLKRERKERENANNSTKRDGFE